MIKQTILVGALFSLCNISTISAMQEDNRHFNGLFGALIEVAKPDDIQIKLDEYWERHIVNGSASTQTKLANTALILGGAKAAVLCKKELIKKSLRNSISGNSCSESLKIGYAQALANLSLTEQKLKINNS